MHRASLSLTLLALIQLSAPLSAGTGSGPSFMMVPFCSEAGGAKPIRLPRRDDGSNGGCCKICHISMRKRGSGDSCCGHDGESDQEDDDVG